MKEAKQEILVMWASWLDGELGELGRTFSALDPS